MKFQWCHKKMNDDFEKLKNFMKFSNGFYTNFSLSGSQSERT